MRLKILTKVHSDQGFLDRGDVVEVEDTTARHYLRRSIGEKIDQEAEDRQTKIVEPEKIKVNGEDIAALIGTPERTKRKYQRRK